MFQLQRATIMPKREQSPGTFNDCALYGRDCNVLTHQPTYDL